jgi:hypothetical protein
MIKSLAAFGIFSLLATSVVALPWFVPLAEASEGLALAKADRLDARPVAVDCANQVWPDRGAACLRGSSSDARIVEARLVTARR